LRHPAPGAWCLVVFKRRACGWVGGCARAVPMTVTHLPVENNDLDTLYEIFVFRDITAIGSESADFLQFFHICRSIQSARGLA